MKKTYMTPATIIVTLQLQRMIAGSGDGNGRNASNSTVSGERQLSRQGGWDDED